MKTKSTFQNYIEQIVNSEEDTFEFPKNESTWEELFEFGRQRILEIVTLKKELMAWKELAEHQTTCGVCADSITNCKVGKALWIKADPKVEKDI